jgi:23S rRNA (guanosine2251-2'-O)-methyltransferase
MSKNIEYLYGIHSVRHLLTYNPEQVLTLWVIDSKARSRELSEIISISKQTGLPMEYVSKSTMDKHSNHGVHQGVMARIRHGVKWHENDLPKIIKNSVAEPLLLLILDGVQDPHNLGACVRTANAAGVVAVVIPKDKTVSVTSTVRKAASGGMETTPVISVTNLSRTIRMLKEEGIWIVGTDSSAERKIYDIDLNIPIAIVMGSEGKGLRKNIREQCDYLVSLPIYGIVESLNLSVAAGVCLYEALRQRNQ